MRAGIIFGGTGPILVLTKCESLDDRMIVQQLKNKGIDKFIAYEVPMDMVKEKYGQHLAVTMGDLKQRDELRVVDDESIRVFHNFPFSSFGQAIYHEDERIQQKAA